MAQRFGGKYSPGGGGGTGGKSGTGRSGVPSDIRPEPAGLRANLMFLPPLILGITAVFGGPVALVLGLLGAAVLTLGAWLLREGLRAEAAFNARSVARRPALPRKIAAAGLAGAGVALAAFAGAADVVGAALYGLAAGGLHLAAFGIDPLADKRPEGVDSFQQDRVARVVEGAEAALADMVDVLGPLRDRALMDSVGAFQASAREMIRTVEEDPRDLTAARKYLSVYLTGARDAARKYAAHAARGDGTHETSARDDFDALLRDLTQNFAARTQRMLADERSDLDIEIKVLRDRLGRDGLADQD